MGRSGFDDGDDYDPLAEGRWIATRRKTFRGKRGQQFLRELLATLELMPEKRLVADDLETKAGAVCAIGAVGKARGLDMSKLDPEDYERVSGAFGISPTMAREIVFTNDDDFQQHGGYISVYWVQPRYDQYRWPVRWIPETAERRYLRMVSWVRSEILSSATNP